jgi:hypothetical protein
MCIRYHQSGSTSGLTVDIQLVQLSIDRLAGIETLRLNGIQQTSLLKVELGGEVDSVKFPHFPIGLIEDILLADTKGGGITGSRKMP